MSFTVVKTRVPVERSWFYPLLLCFKVYFGFSIVIFYPEIGETMEEEIKGIFNLRDEGS